MQPAGQVSQDGKWLWNGTQWVPYQQPLTGVVPWAQPFESARSRSSLAVVFLGGNILSVALLTVATAAIDLAPDHPSDSQSIALGVLALVALIAFFGTYVPATVLFCMWLHRVVRNMPALGSPDPRWTPAGAVGRCFVPFLNFVHPLFGVLDAWRGSDPSRLWLDLAARKATPAPGLIVGWWVLWLVGGYAGNSRIGGTAGAVIDVVGGVTLIGAAVLAIMVVRRLTARQDRKNDLIVSGQLA